MEITDNSMEQYKQPPNMMMQGGRGTRSSPRNRPQQRTTRHVEAVTTTTTTTTDDNRNVTTTAPTTARSDTNRQQDTYDPTRLSSDNNNDDIMKITKTTMDREFSKKSQDTPYSCLQSNTSHRSSDKHIGRSIAEKHHGKPEYGGKLELDRTKPLSRINEKPRRRTIHRRKLQTTDTTSQTTKAIQQKIIDTIVNFDTHRELDDRVLQSTETRTIWQKGIMHQHIATSN